MLGGSEPRGAFGGRLPPAAPREPADLLAEMHHLFEDCFPEGVYVEATLVRLAGSEVTVVPAGGSRFLLRRTGREEVEFITLRGAWLGLAAPAPADQHRWALQPDDELVLGTDGLFDQLCPVLGRNLEGLRRPKTAGINAASRPEGLYERLEQLLRSALQQKPQSDDITVVALRRTLVGSEEKDEGGRMKDEAEEVACLDSSFILPPSSFEGSGGLNVPVRLPSRRLCRQGGAVPGRRSRARGGACPPYPPRGGGRGGRPPGPARRRAEPARPAMPWPASSHRWSSASCSTSWAWSSAEEWEDVTQAVLLHLFSNLDKWGQRVRSASGWRWWWPGGPSTWAG